MKETVFSSLVFLVLLVSFYRCSDKKQRHSYNAQSVEHVDHLKKEVVVFVYHRFGDARYPSTNISLKDFENHLDYLKSNNYTLLTFGDALDYINNPHVPYMDRTACITVDDGYKTFKSNGLPLLRKYGYTATLFINSESVAGGTYLDWDELKEVYEEGIEIGNHSHSHAYFLNKSASDRKDVFKEDVLKCQAEIEKYLGFRPTVFAYPYGEFDLKMKETLRELGFKGAAAQNSGVMYKYDDYAIPRFPMAGPYVKLKGFVEKANMKALRVKQKSDDSYVLYGENPPEITIEFDPGDADLSRHNCFTGNTCESVLHGNSISVKATQKITGRRSLYTITAPSKTSQEWHWFSHLWIRPEIQE
ncbi:MAG: polysaccharide deacetylase family protein [Cytophagales bacterium]|nr:polysaccharide deacetylase family protein [Cytophagales bacterium]